MRLAWLLLAGCASSAVPPARFANAPIALIVDDRRDVPDQPEDREFLPNVYFFDKSVERVITRPMELPRATRALGVNALDEVPDSTWFTNRIGVRLMSPEDVGTGPVTHDPMAHKPWTITSTKVGGTTDGFIVKDASGVKYLLKFDGTGSPPEMETGIHVIVNRLMWACGYNVAEDQILYIKRADLVIAKDAKRKDDLGKTLGPLVAADVDKLLTRVRREHDGQIRTLVSRWIAGKTIGGHPNEGVREDDPNDRIAHEARRDLRGMLPIDTWLDAVDVTEGQFVDAWVEDPAIKNRHYVKHYAVDFGKSMGAMGVIAHDWWRGHSYRVDFPIMFRELFLLGLDEREFQHRRGPSTMRGVPQLFDVDSIEPENWHPDTPGYLAFRDADRYDQFWGTKLLARFTPQQLRAAVEAAKLSDPAATTYLTETLIGRQRVLAAHWFARVNPLDRFAIGLASPAPTVCFDDVAIITGLSAPSTTGYQVTSYDMHGASVGHPVSFGAGTNGTSCSGALPIASDREGYTIYRIDTLRSAYAGSTYVHVARDPATKAFRVIGIWRP